MIKHLRRKITDDDDVYYDTRECKEQLELSGANFLTIIWYLVELLFEEWLMKNGSMKGKTGLWLWRRQILLNHTLDGKAPWKKYYWWW